MVSCSRLIAQWVVSEVSGTYERGPTFARSFLACSAPHELLLRLAPAPAAQGSARGLASAVVWFCAAYASTAQFQAAPLPLALVLALAWCGRVALSPTVDKLLAGPIFAVGGALFEAGLSSTGAFHYRHPDVLHVPVWLPALYLHVSLMTRDACLVVLHRARA